MKIILNIIKWILIVSVLLFALSTFMREHYTQSMVLLLLAIFLAYWPRYFRQHLSRTVSIMTRLGIIFGLLIISFIFYNSKPKASIYLSPAYKENILNEYEEKVTHWPEDTEDIFVQSKFGSVHVLACGSPENPPLIMLHAASMAAHSWAETVAALVKHFRIYSIDNIGEGNKSELNDVLIYPKTQKEISDLYAQLADSLGIASSPVLGSSNGGYIAMNYAYYYPEKVESLALFAPLGLTPLTYKSSFVQSIAYLYPFKFVKDNVAQWTMGKDPSVREKYGDWYYLTMQGTKPSVAKPLPMTKEQKKEMTLPILLFLGTKDPVVGDAVEARKTASDFPSIHVEVMNSGHLISIEHADYVNSKLKEFLNVKSYPLQQPEINNIESIKSSKQLSMTDFPNSNLTYTDFEYTR